MDWKSIGEALNDVHTAALTHKEVGEHFASSLRIRDDQGLAYIHPINKHRSKALITIPPVVSSIQDRLIEIEGLEQSHADREGNILIQNTDSLVFDAINCYAIVRNVIDMYELSDTFCWEWGAFQKLLIVPHSDIPNALYLRNERRIKYGVHNGQFLCRNIHVVAHEAGHAILDSLMPGLYKFKVGEHAAVHEGFADLTAMLFVAIHCSDQLGLSKGVSDIRDVQELSSTGTSCGFSERPVRDANNMYSISDIRNKDSPNSLDMLTEVFTGFFFDIVVAVYGQTKSLPAAGRTVASVIVEAIKVSPSTPTLHDVLYSVKQISNNIKTDYDLSSIISNSAVRRGFEL